MDNPVKSFRSRFKISVDDLAKKIGVSRMTIYRWEKAKHKPHNNHYEKLERMIRTYSLMSHGRTHDSSHSHH
ncbi:MAG: helix-turn-helix domain-containing protein [Candidatus Omnitrophota bacterium]